MIFIFGIANKLTRNQEDDFEICPHCNKAGLMVTVFEDYLHVYWLPIFPVKSKTVLVKCLSCEKEIHDSSLKAMYEKVIKAPWYLYTGLFVVMALLLILLSVIAFN